MKNNRGVFASLFVLLCLASQWTLNRPAQAHPLTQGFMEIITYKDKISVRARVSLEEVMVSNSMRVGDDDLYSITGEHYKKHGLYLLRHWFLSADGIALTGKLISIVPPKLEGGKISPLDLQKENVVFEAEYPIAAAPREIKMYQNVLNEVNYTPGNPWEATYVLRIMQSELEGAEGMLLTSRTPVTHAFPRSAEAPLAPAPEAVAAVQLPARVSTGAMIWNFLCLGIEHILTGYDHLLFVSALVLAAASFWELIKVVAAFTLAHTVTVTASALNLVSLPSNIVEPMIAASIVVIAIQNIFWPQSSKGWGRLAAAFAFGLFHGLGFSSGLREAMGGMPTSAVVTAIIAFSIGVEIGHQIVVVPLFALLSLLRRAKKEEAEREKVSAFAMRYGSVVISVAGMFYLCASLGLIQSPEDPGEKHDAKPAAQQTH